MSARATQLATRTNSPPSPVRALTRVLKLNSEGHISTGKEPANDSLQSSCIDQIVGRRGVETDATRTDDQQSPLIGP